MAEMINIPYKNRFEYSVDDHTAVVDYILIKYGRIVLTHTEVPKSMEGQGIGSKLAKAVFSYTKENKLKVMLLCPFMAFFVRRYRDEYVSILAPSCNV
jgi:predicted GNAT family acetyltransferase